MHGWSRQTAGDVPARTCGAFVMECRGLSRVPCQWPCVVVYGLRCMSLIHKCMRQGKADILRTLASGSEAFHTTPSAGPLARRVALSNTVILNRTCAPHSQFPRTPCKTPNFTREGPICIILPWRCLHMNNNAPFRETQANGKVIPAPFFLPISKIFSSFFFQTSTSLSPFRGLAALQSGAGSRGAWPGDSRLGKSSLQTLRSSGA